MVTLGLGQRLVVVVTRFLSLSVVLLTLPALAAAFPIAAPGTEGLEVIVNSTSPVVATYQGNSAVYSSDLYLMLDGSGSPGDDGNPVNDRFIFNNHASPVGSTVDLGSFPVGTKLIFRLHVNDTGINYFTGPVSRNPDNQAHARAQADWMPNETLVSFEDLFNGPFEYNDLSFSFVPTTAVGRLPGWHSNDGRNSLMFEDPGLRILLGNTYVYESPVVDPLYWYVQVIYVNASTRKSLPISCAGRTDPSLAKEHLQGTANVGVFAADETFATVTRTSRVPSSQEALTMSGRYFTMCLGLAKTA